MRPRRPPKAKPRHAPLLESNPERILDICRCSSFNPGSHLDRIALAVAVSKLSEANHTNGISQFLEELETQPDLYKNESVISHSIVLYGRANMTEHAVGTFEEMDKQGLPHSVNAFNALLFAFILAGVTWFFDYGSDSRGLQRSETDI